MSEGSDNSEVTPYDFDYRVEGIYELVKHPDCELFAAKGVAGHTASLHLGQVYIFGGRIGSEKTWEPSDRLVRYDLEGLTWNEVAKTLPWPPARYHHSAVVGDSSLLIFGGETATTGNDLNDLWEFTFSSQTWRERSTTEGPRPQPMHSHGSVLRGNTLLAFGGKGRGSGGMWSIDVSEGSSETWQKVDFKGPVPSECANSYVLIDDTIYVGDSEDYSLFKFDFNSLTWTNVNGINGGGSMTGLSQMLYITCGYNGAGPTNEVRRFDTKATGLKIGSEWGFITEEVKGNSGPEGDASTQDVNSDEQDDDVVEDDSVQSEPYIWLPELSNHASWMNANGDSIFVFGGLDIEIDVEDEDDFVFSKKLFELKLKPVPATNTEQHQQ